VKNGTTTSKMKTAGMYLAVTVTLSFIVNWMEQRFKVVT